MKLTCPESRVLKKKMLTYRLQTPYILGAQKKSLLRRFSSTHNICGHMFWLKQLMCIIPIFWRFKDKSFTVMTVVSSIIMKEDSYSEPAIRSVEMPCSPEHTKPLETRLFYRTTPIFCFYAQIICNHAPLLCTGHLQNCYHGFIFRCSKEPSH